MTTTKGACRNGCGMCCDPITIGYGVSEVENLRRRGRITNEQAEWVLNVLEPMTPKEAKAMAPWLFTGNFRTAVDIDGGIFTFYYRCTWFDRDTRTCTHYDERPTVCREYPYHGDIPPGMTPALPPACGYLVDFGREPEDIPVFITSKPVGA